MIGKKCVILAGGYINLNSVDIPENAVVLCADSGYSAANALGIEPALIIGDFDLLGFIPNVENVQTFPSEKDDTDTLLAVKEAIKMGADEIFIYGALGGRLDHTIANIQTLMFIENNGAKGMLISDNEYVSLLIDNTSRRFKKREGFYFSVFSYSEKCTGVCISGAEYNLSNGTITNDFPIGVSNHIKEAFAELSIKSGCMLVIESKEV